ncbi:MAG: hypothetical protein ABIP64_12760 [Burkholderiales bacterium]
MQKVVKLEKSSQSKWRRLLWVLLLLGFASLCTSFLLARWFFGPHLQEVYSRVMQTQLAWYEPHYPRLRPLWSLAKWPMIPVGMGERSLLLPAGTEDKYDPTKRFAVGLIDRQLQPLLVAAKDGDTIILPPGRYRDCAIIQNHNLTLKAIQPGTVQFDGGTCEGKAALVARGGQLTIDGLVFRNMRVADGNGAGIRQERGNVVVRNSIFYNSETAILTSAVPGMQLMIDKSLFVRLGRCDGLLQCAHSVYVNGIDKVRVTRSIFLLSAGGHFIKSRARNTEIIGNQLDDTDGVASQLIDLPNGTTGSISNNVMIKGEDSYSRRSFIRVAEETRINDSRDLNISGNQLISKIPLTIFLWNDSQDAVVLGKNQQQGWIIESWGKIRRLQ